MAKKNKVSFRGKVSRNAEKKKKSGFGYRYLLLPDGLEQFKPEASTAWLDIIPYMVTDEHHMDRDDDTGDATPDTPWWKKSFRVHKNVGADKDTIVCPTTFGKKCPICEYVKKEQNDNGVDWDDLKDIACKDRSLYIVVVLNAKKFEEDYDDEKFYILDMSFHLFEKMLLEEVSTDEDFEEFPSPEDGYTIKIRFRQKKFGSAEYCEAAKVDIVPRENQYEDSVIDDAPNLDTLLEVLPYDKIKSMFLDFEDSDGEDDSKEEEADEEVSKIKSLRKPKTTKNKDVEDKEEHSTKKPKPTRTTQKSKPSDECPYGYEFGVDTEEYKECDDCDVWDECAQAKEKSAEK